MIQRQLLQRILYIIRCILSTRQISPVVHQAYAWWLSVLNERINRGVKDIRIICADGLTGIKEAISAAFPALFSVERTGQRKIWIAQQ